MPLQNRRLQKLGEKVLGSPHHVGRSAYQPHWTNEFRTISHKNESIYTLTHSFFSSLNLTLLAPTFPAIPLWLNNEIDIDISLHESISKKDDNPELIRLISLDHIDRYNTHTHTHTHTKIAWWARNTADPELWAINSSSICSLTTLFFNKDWFPNLTRAYDNNGRCPRQKFVLGILQLLLYSNIDH